MHYVGLSRVLGSCGAFGFKGSGLQSLPLGLEKTDIQGLRLGPRV